MKEVIVRLLSGVIYISIILFSLFMAREWYIGLLFILAIITLNEFLKLINTKRNNRLHHTCCIILFFSL